MDFKLFVHEDGLFTLKVTERDSEAVVEEFTGTREEIDRFFEEVIEPKYLKKESEYGDSH